MWSGDKINVLQKDIIVYLSGTVVLRHGGMDLGRLWQLLCLCYVSASSLIYLQMTSWITVRSETWQRRQLKSVSVINAPQQPETLLRSHALSRSIRLSGLIYPCRHLKPILTCSSSGAVLSSRDLGADGGSLWAAWRVVFTDPHEKALKAVLLNCPGCMEDPHRGHFITGAVISLGFRTRACLF